MEELCASGFWVPSQTSKVTDQEGAVDEAIKVVEKFGLLETASKTDGLLLAGKMPLEVENRLLEKGLLSPNNDGDEGFRTSAALADVLVSIFARKLATENEGWECNFTARAEARFALLATETRGRQPDELSVNLALSLIQELPSVNTSLGWQPFVEFRREHEPEANKFKKHLAELTEELEASQKVDEVKSLAERLQAESRAYSEALNSSLMDKGLSKARVMGKKALVAPITFVAEAGIAFWTGGDSSLTQTMAAGGVRVVTFAGVAFFEHRRESTKTSYVRLARNANLFA
jgi:type II secretory pathway component PulM